MANNKGKCQVCAAISESFCSWCKLVFYCSREHQKKDWENHKETCTKKKYRMEENEQLGRHLVASEDIKPDLILFKDKPLVLSYKLDSLEYTGNKICLGCYKEIPSVERRRRTEGHYNKDKDEDRKTQMKRAAAVASLLEKVVAVDKERKQAAAPPSPSPTTDTQAGKGESCSSSLLALQSGNNEQEEEEADGDHHRQRENDDGGDDQQDDNNDENSSSVDNNESDEYGDNSNEDKDNEDDSSGGEEEEKVCLSCHLPICSPLCSTQYFHKNFECKLVREAHYHQQQQLLQNPNPVLSSSSSSASEGDSMGTREQGKHSSNQDPMSLGTTCKNTSSPCSSSTKNMITSLRNGIRETLLRNLLYLRCLLLKHVNEGHWNQLISLQSNEETRKGDVSSLEKTTQVFSTLKKIMTEINHPTLTSRQLVHKPDIHKLVGLIEINALNVSISQNVEVTGIYPTFSLMEHSCIPSVKYYLVPCGGGGGGGSSSAENPNPSHKKTSTFLELYCRSAIKLKKGDHLSVAYTNAMWNTEKRREFLKKERHFWCECPRCMDRFELGSNFSTILCPLPECKGSCVPVPIPNPTGGGAGGAVRAANNNEIQWKCTSAKCGKTCAAWQVKILDTKLCEMVGRTKPSIEGYKECLAKMEELVHPDYYLCCIVTHSLIQMCGHDMESVHDKALLEEKIALCNKLLAVFKKLDPGLANLNIYASIVFYEIQNAILALAGAEVDDDFHILRSNPQTVNLAKVYLQKCFDCFKYEVLEVPESKLKILAMKKMEYLNTVMNRR